MHGENMKLNEINAGSYSLRIFRRKWILYRNKLQFLLHKVLHWNFMQLC